MRFIRYALVISVQTLKEVTIFRIYSILCVLLFMSGCATVNEMPKGETVFYPPLPDEPRIQYLTSFSSSIDLEGEAGGFAKFVLGEDISVKPIIKPYGVTLRDGKIYVCDTVNNSVDVLDINKKIFTYFLPSGAGRLRAPINLEISPEGKRYVADARRGQVLIFDSLGKYLTAIGRKGELKPTDVAIKDDQIFVCDLKSHSVRVYQLSDNAFLYSIPPGRNKEKGKTACQLYSPTNIDIDTDGNLYISDAGSFSVKKCSVDGTLLKTFGIHGDTPGAFARPKGTAVDRDGRVYIVDAAFENVQIFDPDGKLLLFFPEQEDSKRLVLPAGIFIDYDNVEYFRKFIDKDFEVEYLVLVVSQYGARKINVFGFGKKK